MNQTVLVTGGGGFIGSNLVEDLLDLGYKVRVLDDFSTGDIRYLDLSNDRLEVFVGSILNRSDIERALSPRVDTVFHLAAASKVAPSLKDPSMATFNVELNAVGTALLLEYSQKFGVTKFIYAASSTFYGNQAVPFHESASFNPTSPYAASKYMGEILLQTYIHLYNIKGVSLRFFMVYGKRQPRYGPYAIVTGKFLERAKAGLPLNIEGTGDQFRDFVHVKDVSRACILALQNSHIGKYDVINVGSGMGISINDIANMISTDHVHVPERPHDLKGTLADTCNAKKKLGFASQVDFEIGIQESASLPSELAPVWLSSDVNSFLETYIPTYNTADDSMRSSLIVRTMTDLSFKRSLMSVLKKEDCQLYECNVKFY